MKKISIILILITSLLFTACSGGESKDKGEEDDKNKTKSAQKIDMKSSKEFMDNYMRYVIKMDTDVMKSFYSTKFKAQIKDIEPTTNPHPIGYKIGEGEGKEGKAEYKVNIFNAYTGSPYYSNDTYKYSVVMEDGKMLIDNITKDKVMEVFEKNKTLFMKEGSKVQGKYIMSLEELPTYASPQSSLEKKLPVPRDAFGPCTLSPDDKKIVITSMGKDSFIAIGEFEEEQSAMTQQMAQGEDKAGGDKKGGEEGGQEGKESKGEGEEKLEKAKIKIKPVDLYVNSKINIMVFSPDGKTLAVESVPSGGLSQFKLYKAQEGEIINIYRINNNFRSDRFALSNPYFVSETTVAFTVKAINGAQDEEKELEGDWSYDIKTETLKQSK